MDHLRRKNLSFLFCFALFISLFQVSCKTSKTTKGAVIGAVVGGAAGALLTKKNKAVGIILGAAIGGVAGGIIGAYMDKQAKNIEDDLQEEATVTRVGEGIVVSFDTGLLFDFESHTLKSETKENLKKLSNSLNKYEKTEVNILGHTDSTGSNSFNQDLSEKRSTSVKTYLSSLGVGSTRLLTQGLGETDPVIDNDSKKGRQMNRRVEIVIVANDELKKEAMASSNK